MKLTVRNFAHCIDVGLLAFLPFSVHAAETEVTVDAKAYQSAEQMPEFLQKVREVLAKHNESKIRGCGSDVRKKKENVSFHLIIENGELFGGSSKNAFSDYCRNLRMNLHSMFGGFHFRNSQNTDGNKSFGGHGEDVFGSTLANVFLQSDFFGFGSHSFGSESGLQTANEAIDFQNHASDPIEQVTTLTVHAKAFAMPYLNRFFKHAKALNLPMTESIFGNERRDDGIRLYFGQRLDWQPAENNFLETVSAPSVTTIGKDAFRCCRALLHINDTENNLNPLPRIICTTLDDVYFDRTEAPNVVSSSKGTFVRIGANAFNGCHRLQYVSASVDYLGREAFGECTDLKSVHMLFSRSTYCGNGVFRNCLRLREWFGMLRPRLFSSDANALPLLSERAFDTDFLPDIHQYNDGRVEIISHGEVWCDFNAFFENCFSLESLSMPNIVTEGFFEGSCHAHFGIGQRMCNRHRDLEAQSAEFKGKDMFRNCISLKNIDVRSCDANLRWFLPFGPKNLRFDTALTKDEKRNPKITEMEEFFDNRCAEIDKIFETYARDDWAPEKDWMHPWKQHPYCLPECIAVCEEVRDAFLEYPMPCLSQVDTRGLELEKEGLFLEYPGTAPAFQRFQKVYRRWFPVGSIHLSEDEKNGTPSAKTVATSHSMSVKEEVDAPKENSNENHNPSDGKASDEKAKVSGKPSSKNFKTSSDRLSPKDNSENEDTFSHKKRRRSDSENK